MTELRPSSNSIRVAHYSRSTPVTGRIIESAASHTGNPEHRRRTDGMRPLLRRAILAESVWSCSTSSVQFKASV
ncbi:hypothetical protein [Nocardia heshunensis]